MTSVEKALIDHEILECEEGKEEEHLEVIKDDIKDSKTAWLVCFCAVIDQLFITGLINVFGVFFVEFVREFGASKGKVAWLGSMSYGLMKLFAPVVSVFVKKYTNRVAMIIGSAFCAASVFSTSFVTDINVMFLTFPVLYGIGTSLVINPSMVISSGYFSKHLGLATGLVCAGSSIGSVTLAPFCQSLVDSVGWRMTFRWMTGIYLGLCLLNLLVKPLPRGSVTPMDTVSQPLVRGLVEDLKLWKNRVFLLWATATAFVMFGYYIPCVHLVSFAIGEGIPADRAAYLLMALGGATTVSRLLFGKIVQTGFMNRLHLHQLAMIITGTGFMILPNITTFPGLLAYCIVIGLVDGCYIVLLPILTCALIGADKAVVAWCFMSGFSSVTFTLGPPVSGFLCDMTGSYDIAFHIAGIPVILGAVILFFVPWAQRTATTTNVMRVLSTEVGQQERSHPQSVGSESSDETIHLSIPESSPFSGLPCFINPHYRSQYPESKEFLYNPDNDDSESQAAGRSAPDISSEPRDVGTAMQGVDPSTFLHHSAPVFEAYREQFISIPRRDSTCIDGYLEELRKSVCVSHNSNPNLLAPSHSSHLSQAQVPPYQVSSHAISSVTSSMDQLLKEHIDLFLADLAARRVSGLSTSSGVNRSMSRTLRISPDPGQINPPSGNIPTSASRLSAGRHNQGTQTVQNFPNSGSRTSCQSSAGAQRVGTQQQALASSSELSDTSRDSAGSSSTGRLRRTSNTSNGPKELDVFSHLFNDDET